MYWTWRGHQMTASLRQEVLTTQSQYGTLKDSQVCNLGTALEHDYIFYFSLVPLKMQFLNFDFTWKSLLKFGASDVGTTCTLYLGAGLKQLRFKLGLLKTAHYINSTISLFSLSTNEN